MLFFAVFVLILVANTGVDGRHVIGAIFYGESVNTSETLKTRAEECNMDVSIKNIEMGDILNINNEICNLAAEGVVGVVDGTIGRDSAHVQALCDMLELPHVTYRHNDLYTTEWSTINLYPSSEAYNSVLKQIIEYKEWSNFTILYVKGHSLQQVSDLLMMGNETDRSTVTVRELAGEDYRDVLKEAKEANFKNYIVDCPTENLDMFLLHAQQVGIITEEFSYIFLSPDLFALELNRYRYSGVNITGFRLTEPGSSELNKFATQFSESIGYLRTAEQLTTDVLLMHDVVEVFNSSLKTVEVKGEPIDCKEMDSWKYGSSLLNFMKTNKISGLTRALNFDGFGQRTDVTLDILEMTPAGNQEIGKFEHGILEINRPFVPAADLTGESRMKNKTFKVLIAKVAPYGYIKDSTEHLQGNDRYEGFTVDLIAKLSEILGFEYLFEVGGVYGSKNKDGEWDGMIREIMDEKADFGICDFTITSERQSAIDFSVPFMSLGISILYKRPSKQPPEMFAFMTVFSTEVWWCVFLVQIGLGIIMILVGRISHKEWQNPVPCIEQPDEFTNQFSFANSVWLIIGSVMQQGSEIAPIAIGPRMITSVWWFFTMVIVASYTGSLLSQLVVENDVMPFNNVEELARSKNIKYGAKAQGTTISFFIESKTKVYQDMYYKMKTNGWLVKDNDVGAIKADTENYACFMESTSIDYYKERRCDLMQVGGLLDSKSYGIGMKKGSEYKKYIDIALLQLKESGEIARLKNKWWKEKRGGGNCEGGKSGDPQQLGMKNMMGAFVVLGVGCLIGLFISTFDMLWGVFKRSVKYNTQFRDELIEELKFALKFSGDVKPVRRQNPANESSEALSAANQDEAKDELMSLRSVRSSDTNRTHHSHSSKHSAGSQSVAFARMRN